MQAMYVALAIVLLSGAAILTYKLIKAKLRRPEIIAEKLFDEAKRLLYDSEHYGRPELIEDAVDILERILTLDLPELDWSRQKAGELLASTWAKQGNSDPPAMRLYERCVYNGFETPDILQLVSYWWIEQGRDDEPALKLIDKTLKHFDRDEVLLLYMVDQYKARSDKIQYLQCLLRLFMLSHREESIVIPLTHALVKSAESNKNGTLQIDYSMLGAQFESDLRESADLILIWSLKKISTEEVEIEKTENVLVKTALAENNTKLALEPFYCQFVERNPNDIQAITHLAKIYFNNEQIDKALTMYFRFIHGKTDKSDIVLNITKELQRRGRKDYQALSVYQKALALQPRNTQLYQIIADSIISCQLKEKELITYLEKATEFYPNDVDYMRYLLSLYDKHDMAQKTIDLAHRIQKNEHDDKNTVLTLAKAYMKLEKTGPEVVKVCELAKDLAEEEELDKRVYKVLAYHYCHQQSKDLQHLSIIEDYLKHYPDDVELRLYLAKSYFEFKDLFKAEFSADKVLQGDQNDTRAMKIIAQIKKERDGFEKSESYWWDLYKKNPDDYELIEEFSNLLAKSNQLGDEAAGVYEKQRKNKEEDYACRRMLFRYHLGHQQFDEALTIVDEVNSIAEQNGLSKVIFYCKEVIECGEILIEESPVAKEQIARAHFMLGKYYFEDQKFQPSLEEFRDVAALTSDFDGLLIQELSVLSNHLNNVSEAMFDIGRLYYRLKKHRKAIDILEELYYTDDRPNDVTELLLKIYREYLADNPDDFESNYRAAKILLGTQNYDEAVVLLQHLEKNDYNKKQVQLHLIEAFVLKGHLGVAKENLEEILKSGCFEDNLQGYFIKAILCKEDEDFDEALKLGERIYAKDASCMLESGYRINDFLTLLSTTKRPSQPSKKHKTTGETDWPEKPIEPPPLPIPPPGPEPELLLKEIPLAKLVDDLIHKTSSLAKIKSSEDSDEEWNPDDGTTIERLKDVDFSHLPRIQQSYSNIEPIGVGGMSVVYMANDIKKNVPVVLKQVKMSTIKEQELLISTIQAEAELLKKADKHARIVKIFDFIEPDLLVMEYVGGKTFAEILKYTKSLTEEEEYFIRYKDLMRCFYQICEGLQYIHRQGIIHRDIKPSNIMVDRKRDIKILDFGIAVTKHCVASRKAGTPDYMAPEIIENPYQTDHHPRSDIYSLGITMYELFTGVHPKMTPYCLPMRKIRTNCPAVLDGIIDRMMHPDESKRFQSVEDILSKLSRIMQKVKSIDSVHYRKFEI